MILRSRSGGDRGGAQLNVLAPGGDHLRQGPADSPYRELHLDATDVGSSYTPAACPGEDTPGETQRTRVVKLGFRFLLIDVLLVHVTIFILIVVTDPGTDHQHVHELC